MRFKFKMLLLCSFVFVIIAGGTVYAQFSSSVTSLGKVTVAAESDVLTYTLSEPELIIPEEEVPLGVTKVVYVPATPQVEFEVSSPEATPPPSEDESGLPVESTAAGVEIAPETIPEATPEVIVEATPETTPLSTEDSKKQVEAPKKTKAKPTYARVLTLTNQMLDRSLLVTITPEGGDSKEVTLQPSETRAIELITSSEHSPIHVKALGEFIETTIH